MKFFIRYSYSGQTHDGYCSDAEAKSCCSSAVYGDTWREMDIEEFPDKSVKFKLMGKEFVLSDMDYRQLYRAWKQLNEDTDQCFYRDGQDYDQEQEDESEMLLSKFDFVGGCSPGDGLFIESGYCDFKIYYRCLGIKFSLH